MISNGFGRLRILGGPSGSQCKVGAFSLPATAVGPCVGFAASNLACPQGVNGGRNLSSMAFMPGTPGTGPSGYCIQTPDRSCERDGAVALVIIGRRFRRRAGPTLSAC